MQTKEDYLRVMHHLNDEKGVIKSSEIAVYLNISKPSVSEMLTKLYDNKLIENPSYSDIKLTKKGMAEAVKITNKHRVIERFLQDTLKISKNKVHEEAHKLEHAFSDNVLFKLNEFLNHPKTCPHGKPIN